MGMQQDFHFYGIYALARAAGIEDEHAQIMAYASQYMDDAKSEARIRFEDGGSYQPMMTAHRFLTLDILSENVFLKIFVPFHFLPGNVEEKDFYKRMICLPDSLPAREMIADVLSDREKPYFFHRMGIALHTYADSWAHQNFSGLLRPENRVSDLKVEGQLLHVDQYFDENWMRQTINLIPPLGHGQAGSIPDIPYKKWKYRNHEGREIEVNNAERFLSASEAIFKILCLISDHPVRCPWERMGEYLKKIFSYRGDLKQRIAYWKRWIQSGEFGFRKEGLDYHPDLWQQDAVEMPDKKRSLAKRKAGFRESNWKLFYDAAILHRFYILHELLPQYDIYCS